MCREAIRTVHIQAKSLSALVMLACAFAGPLMSCSSGPQVPPPKLPPPTRTAQQIQNKLSSLASRTWVLVHVSGDLPAKLQSRGSPHAARAEAWRARCVALSLKFFSASAARDLGILVDFDNPAGPPKSDEANVRDIDAEVDGRLDAWDADVNAVESEFRDLINLLADTQATV